MQARRLKFFLRRKLTAYKCPGLRVGSVTSFVLIYFWQAAKRWTWWGTLPCPNGPVTPVRLNLNVQKCTLFLTARWLGSVDAYCIIIFPAPPHLCEALALLLLRLWRNNLGIQRSPVLIMIIPHQVGYFRVLNYRTNLP